MTDWFAIAGAIGARVSEDEARRNAAVLAALEGAFEPSSRELPFEAEPATLFHAEDGEDA